MVREGERNKQVPGVLIKASRHNVKMKTTGC